MRALQYIPSILSLQMALMRKYNRKVDKNEASTQITVETLLKGKHNVIIGLFQSYALMREGLFMC